MEYLVASVGDWNRKLFEELSEKLPGDWQFVCSPEELSQKISTGFKPRYIFFPHWRWIVPKDIVNQYECVCFHMTDLPYGRGGSPLQNLIVRGHKETVLTVLKMEVGVDTGPVYLKRALSLLGKASDIYQRASELTWEIIEEMIVSEPTPIPQKGEVTNFQRRTAKQSEIKEGLNAEQVFDYIRMLDAPGYPKAFLDTGTYHLEFEEAQLETDEVIAQVRIRVKG